jgi:hypothetical protein
MHAIFKRGQSMGSDTQFGGRKDLKFAFLSFVLLCSKLFANVRPGLQYWIYDKFDGASSDCDHAGRNASDNKTRLMFLWAAV